MGEWRTLKRPNRNPIALMYSIPYGEPENISKADLDQAVRIGYKIPTPEDVRAISKSRNSVELATRLRPVRPVRPVRFPSVHRIKRSPSRGSLSLKRSRDLRTLTRLLRVLAKWGA
jgi:hypothetical protein